jgi:hypothetical protein
LGNVLIYFRAVRQIVIAPVEKTGAAKIISFVAPFPDAARAANPYGFPPSDSPDLPALIDRLLESWAFRLGRPEFTVTSQRDAAALRFPAPIGPERIEWIEGISDTELQPATR